jgi:hypothetical protein
VQKVEYVDVLVTFSLGHQVMPGTQHLGWTHQTHQAGMGRSSGSVMIAYVYDLGS